MESRHPKARTTTTDCVATKSAGRNGQKDDHLPQCPVTLKGSPFTVSTSRALDTVFAHSNYGAFALLARAAFPLSGDGEMFLFPWYPAFMLAVESSNVIDIRLRRIATGAVNAADETQLMVSEKVDAAVKARNMLVYGKNPAEVIDFYRKRVAANLIRLA